MNEVQLYILDQYYKEEFFLSHIVKQLYTFPDDICIGLLFSDIKFYDLSGAEYKQISDKVYLLLDINNYKKVIHDLKQMIILDIIKYFKDKKSKFIIPIYIYPETGEYFGVGLNHWSIKLYELFQKIGVDSYLYSTTCKTKTDVSYNFIDKRNIDINNDILISMKNYDGIPNVECSYFYYACNQFYESKDTKMLYILNYITNYPEHHILDNHYDKIITSFQAEKLCIIKNNTPTFVEPYMNNFKLCIFHEDYYTLQHWGKKYILIYLTSNEYFKIKYDDSDLSILKNLNSSIELELYVWNKINNNEIINKGNKSGFKSQNDIIDIFKDCGMFVTSNYSTYLSFIAVLLGIESVVITHRRKIPYNIPLFGIKYGFNDNIDFWKDRELFIDYIKTQNREMEENCEKLVYKIYKDLIHTD